MKKLIIVTGGDGRFAKKLRQKIKLFLNFLTKRIKYFRYQINQ